MSKESFNVDEYKDYLRTVTDIHSCIKVPIPKIEENQNYIFVSYSHVDFKKVYSDLADLYAAGVRFWYDRGLSAGKKWEEEVEAKLNNPCCIGVIFYMSENLFISKSVMKEIAIVYDMSSNNAKLNYFSVNLKDTTPFQILMQILQKNSASFDMNQLRVLSSAFPDNITYLWYKSPHHTNELIQQIREQFGVLDDESVSEILQKLQRDIFELHGELEYLLSSEDGEWNEALRIGEKIIERKITLCEIDNKEENMVSLADTYVLFSSVLYGDDEEVRKAFLSEAIEIFKKLYKKHPFKERYKLKIKELEDALTEKEDYERELNEFRTNFLKNGGKEEDFIQAELEWKFERLFGKIED